MDGTAATPERRERVRLYRTDAIVLRRRDLGEADRILTIFTERHGKLRVVAKGVRKTRSRLAGHLEPFAKTSLMLAQGRNLDIVTQAQLLEPYLRMRQDESRIAYAGYFADLLDALTVEAQEHEAAYDALADALRLLDQELDPYPTARLYEIRLLGLLGYRPELWQCVSCGRELEPVVNAFSPSAGGVLCEGCARGDPQALALSVNALKFLRLLQREDVGRVHSLRLSGALRTEVELVTREYVRHILERDLGSLTVLRALSH